MNPFGVLVNLSFGGKTKPKFFFFSDFHDSLSLHTPLVPATLGGVPGA